MRFALLITDENGRFPFPQIPRLHQETLGILCQLQSRGARRSLLQQSCKLRPDGFDAALRGYRQEVRSAI
ncbi:hypothetical protein D3C73_1247640 [compost metagenome]